jgi:hypothetical protein
MFEMILQTAPDDIGNYLALKEVYRKLNRDADFKRVTKSLTDVYLASGQREEAARQCADVLQLDPEDADALSKLRETGYPLSDLPLPEGAASGRKEKQEFPSVDQGALMLGTRPPGPADLPGVTPGLSGQGPRETRSKDRPESQVVVGATPAAASASDEDWPVKDMAKTPSGKLIKDEVGKALGAILVQHGLVTRQHLEEAIVKQKEHHRPIGEILVDSGHATDENIINALVEQAGVPYVPLANYDITDEVAMSIPKDVALRYGVMPMDKIGGSLLVAMAVPLNKEQKKELQGHVRGMKLTYFISSWSDIKTKHQQYYG